jgi:hypothetical protein
VAAAETLAWLVLYAEDDPAFALKVWWTVRRVAETVEQATPTAERVIVPEWLVELRERTLALRERVRELQRQWEVGRSAEYTG